MPSVDFGEQQGVHFMIGLYRIKLCVVLPIRFDDTNYLCCLYSCLQHQKNGCSANLAIIA
jgi:hypothetical protein